MSNVLITADLHLDFWAMTGRNPLDRFDFSGIELMIIAGDLTNKPKVRWKEALKLIGERIPLDRVHVIPGNHDYYDFRLDADDRLADFAHDAGAHLAQKVEIVHGTTRYLCCTLWTDMALGTGSVEENAGQARWLMNDYRYIRIGCEGFCRARPGDTIAMHRDHLNWLRSRLETKFAGDTVVVTHHAPHPNALLPGASLVQCYASDLTDLIETCQPAAWYYGHTHHPAEFRIGNTLIRNVSVGYPD